jgi:hypothetical protein
MVKIKFESIYRWIVFVKAVEAEILGLLCADGQRSNKVVRCHKHLIIGQLFIPDLESCKIAKHLVRCRVHSDSVLVLNYLEKKKIMLNKS